MFQLDIVTLYFFRMVNFRAYLKCLNMLGFLLGIIFCFHYCSSGSGKKSTVFQFIPQVYTLLQGSRIKYDY